MSTVNPRAGIYCRVSTEEQIDNSSIPMQIERLTNYCAAKDYRIVEKYVDPGFSGSNMNRPALQRLIEDVKLKKIDTVVVYKLDRLSRSQKDTLYLIEDVFKKQECAFVSMCENFDTSTPLGMAMVGILSVFAQLERQQITDRLQSGKVARAKKGYFHGGGHPPVGYRYENGELIPDDFEKMLVIESFRLYNSGWSETRIQQYFMEQGFLLRGNQIKYPSTIHNIITSRVYIGYIKYNGEWNKGHHETLIDNETFERAQSMLSSRQAAEKDYATPFKANSLLGGIMFCARCGARYHAYRVRDKLSNGESVIRRYYGCYSRTKSNKVMIHDPSCKNKIWNVESLNEKVMFAIRQLAFDDRYYDSVASSPISSSAIDQSSVNARLKDIEAQLGRLTDLYVQGSMPQEILQSRSDALINERADLQRSLLHLAEKPEPKKLSKKKAQQLAAALVHIPNDAQLEDRRTLLKALVSHIVIEDTNVTIYWTF